MNMDKKACPCGCGLDNMSEALIQRLAEIEQMTEMQLTLTSGARCIFHNAQVKGARNSAHLRGLAADIFCESNKDRWNIITAATTVGINRIGIGDTFIHLDIDPLLTPQRMWTY